MVCGRGENAGAGGAPFPEDSISGREPDSSDDGRRAPGLGVNGALHCHHRATTVGARPAVCVGASGVVVIADAGATTRTGAVMPPWGRARTVARSGPSCCGIVLDLGANTPAGSLLDSALASNRLVAVVILGRLDASASRRLPTIPQGRPCSSPGGAPTMAVPRLQPRRAKSAALAPDQSLRDRHRPMLVGHCHLTPPPRSPIARSGGIWKSTHTSAGSTPLAFPPAPRRLPLPRRRPRHRKPCGRPALLSERPRSWPRRTRPGGRDLVRISWVDHRPHAVSLRRRATVVRTCRYAVR
jgi:hypothetical protein